MEAGEVGIDPSDLTLQSQLYGIKWWVDPTDGKIQIEKKEDIVKRLGRSPDHADTVMMATVPTDEWELVSQDRLARPENEAAKRGASETADLLGRTF
jgi:hypothetical protein